MNRPKVWYDQSLRPLKRNTISVGIRKPVSEVFAFVIHPVNSHLWEPSVHQGEARDWPPQEGSIFRYKSHSGKWEEFIVTSLQTDRAFIMKMTDGNYHVQYTFTPVSETETTVERYEWVIRGMLPEVTPRETLDNLRKVLEQG